MNENNKPLIFLEPLSETLKKLREVLNENSESEGIDIFDVGSIEEASQLIPTIGQSVILTASPKTCAMTLQSNRKYIKQFQTKVLLLTPKAIPRKTLDKFMKVGLTECIVEPVNPKTLLYKVRLQLRSITAKKRDDEGELQKKFNDDSDQDTNNLQEKMRAEKGVILDEENSEENNHKRKDVKEETLEDYTKPKEKAISEQSIEGFYKGKHKREEVELDDDDTSEKRKKGYQEEVIEGHYKGKLNQQEESEEEPDHKGTKYESAELEEDLEAIKRQINLEVEEDYNKKKRKEILDDLPQEAQKKTTSLNIEEEEEDDQIKTREDEDLGGHYKGEVNKNALDIEDDSEEGIKQEREAEDFQHMKGKSSKGLNIEEDDEEEYLDKEDAPEEIIAKKKSTTLTLEEEDDESDNLVHPELDIVEDEDKKDLLQEDTEYEDIKRKKGQSLDIEDEEAEDEENSKKVDDIDGYLRGGKARKDINIEDDFEDLYKDEKSEDEENKKRKEMASLDIDDDDSEKDPLLGEKEYGTEGSRKKKAADLNIADDELNNKSSNGEEESDLERTRSKYEEEQRGDFGKKHSAHTENKDERHNKSNSKADHIKTHYSSRESIKHNEKDWDSNWEKAGKAEKDFSAAKQDAVEISHESKDLGEQTIDYSQLKKEFEGMDFSDTRKKMKKEYGDFDQIAEVKTYLKSIHSPTGTLESMVFEEVQAGAEDEEESHQVFLPESKGMEIVIEILNFYQRDKIQLNSIFNFISMKINDLFDGDITLYSINEQSELNLFHSGNIIRELGVEPQRPKEEDAFDKREFKLLIKEFEEESREYKSNALDIQSKWKQKWETRLDQWKACQTPKWRDHTFQEEDNEFIFPFYEGVSLLGLVLFTPYKNFVETRSGALEVALESLRAPMLTRYHEIRGTGEQRTKISKQIADKNDAKKSTGFFSKLFGKKAG